MWPAVIVLLVVVADQLTKTWAVSNLADGSTHRILGEFLRLSLVYNTGGALGTNLGSSSYYLVVSLVLLPFICYYLYQYRERAAVSLPLAFIAGGAIGNIIDRLRYGKVIDFIDMDFFDMNLFGYRLDRWWTYNIADAAISCAIVMLLIVMMTGHAQKESPAPPSES